MSLNDCGKLRALRCPRIFALLAVIAALAFTGGAVGRAADLPLTVAVLDFDAAKELEPGFGSNAAALVSAHLSVETSLWLVERAELEKLLNEQELGLSGNVSTETAAKVGQITGAKVLVTGRAFRAGRETIMVAKVISTETSRVYGELVKGGSAVSVSDLAGELAGKLAAAITSKRDTLVAKVITREERLTALKVKLPAGRRPSVRVKIPEQHFGAPVIDPAAQTEIVRWLKDCDFTVLDDRATDKPDFEISGEAFSAFGLRRGNLISCKARVEIKVTGRDPGEVAVSDSQAGVAVDITEQTAAKEALSEAAARLIERVIPKLAQ
jgi:hypothetical protein